MIYFSRVLWYNLVKADCCGRYVRSIAYIKNKSAGSSKERSRKMKNRRKGRRTEMGDMRVWNIRIYRQQRQWRS